MAFRQTENWNALVNDNDWGIAKFTHLSKGTHLNHWHANGGSGDHQGTCMTSNQVESLCMQIDPGEEMQTRERMAICYLGDVQAARQFFETYKPVTAGDFSEDFDSNEHMRGWWRNSNPTTLPDVGGSHGVVVQLADPHALNDLSLRGRIWGDAAYSADVGLTPGADYHYVAYTVDLAGNHSDPATPLGISVPDQASGVEPDQQLPAARLMADQANPIGPGSSLRYELGATGPVTLTLTDLQGRHIRTLIADRQSASICCNCRRARWGRRAG